MKGTGVILAGGKSSRMGRDKSLLMYDNKTIIARAVEELAGVVKEIIIISNQLDKYGFPGVKEVSDKFTGMGPLAGIQAGLLAADHDRIFVTACDMPFLDGRLVKFLLEQSDGFDVTVPQIGSYLQPLFAVYHKRCLPHVEACLKQNISKIIAFYPNVQVNYVGENLIRAINDPETVFYNVNTPKDYEEIIKMEGSNAGE